jgi:uncharacterized protein (DUF2235 family)
MPKNIIICCDGTGNSFTNPDSDSNVIKLYSTLDFSSNAQVGYYHPGVGTLGNPMARNKLSSAWSIVKGLAFGSGLLDNVGDAYRFLMNFYQKGDAVYLFGFSRGAYTVRALAGVLHMFGVLQAGNDDLIRYMLRMYARKTRDAQRMQNTIAAATAFKTSISRECPLQFVGVWDTVAALGWGRFFKNRYDLHFPREISFARHAMAIDEYRKDFARVKWGGSSLPPNRPGKPDIFQQIWFAGSHADIGGSYPETESRLSDVSLKWMVDFITQELPEEARVDIDQNYMRLCPSPDGMMHDECMVGIGGGPVHWYPVDRDVPVDAVLHPSVYERLALPSVRNYTSYGKYRPAPLRNHNEAKKYFEEELRQQTSSPRTDSP